MEFPTNLIRSRLVWCRLERMQASTKEEADRFLAEEEGLLDAMLGRDRLDMYGHDQQARRESYQIGLHDGQALMGLQRWSNTRQSILRNGGGRAFSVQENQRVG